MAACSTGPAGLAGPMASSGLRLCSRYARVRPMAGAGRAKFWLKLHNPVTSPYKVEGSASVNRVERVSGLDRSDEVEERRRERSCGA